MLFNAVIATALLVASVAAGPARYTVSVRDDSSPLRRRDVSCDGFTTKSQKTSESASVQVSDIVDCSVS
jgi:hypothetical protein